MLLAVTAENELILFKDHLGMTPIDEGPGLWTLTDPLSYRYRNRI